jgi:hypothetical protein
VPQWNAVLITALRLSNKKDKSDNNIEELHIRMPFSSPFSLVFQFGQNTKPIPQASTQYTLQEIDHFLVHHGAVGRQREIGGAVQAPSEQ